MVKGKNKIRQLPLTPRSKFAKMLEWRRFQQKKVPSGKAYKRVSKTQILNEEE